MMGSVGRWRWVLGDREGAQAVGDEVAVVLTRICSSHIWFADPWRAQAPAGIAAGFSPASSAPRQQQPSAAAVASGHGRLHAPSRGHPQSRAKKKGQNGSTTQSEAPPASCTLISLKSAPRPNGLSLTTTPAAATTTTPASE